jgi:lysozyme
MRVSSACLEIIKKNENLSLEPYRCPAGKLTIGYCHTANVSEDDVITIDDADGLLIEDLRNIEKIINRYVYARIKQNHFDALASFIFNVGVGNFRKSALLKKLNSGDFNGASLEFLRWVHVKDSKFNGRVRRRQDEYNLFINDERAT